MGQNQTDYLNACPWLNSIHFAENCLPLFLFVCMCFQKPDYGNIASAAQNLLTLLAGQVEVSGQRDRQGEIQGQQHPSQGPCQEPKQANVQQEMSKLGNIQCVYTVYRMWVIEILYDMPFNLLYRSFPGLFRKKCGKRKFPAPFKTFSPKGINIQFCLLHKPMTKTPQGSQELSLLMAGLGKRTISVPENSKHSEVSVSKMMYHVPLQVISLINASPMEVFIWN